MSNFSRVLRYQSSDASLADDWVVITICQDRQGTLRATEGSSEESESETAPAAPKAAAKVAAKASAKAAAVPHPPGAPPPPPPPHNPDNVLSDSDSVDSLEITHGSGRHGRRGTEPAREAAPNPAPKRTAEAAAREAATQKDCVSEVPDVKHAPLSRVLTLALQEKGDDIEEVTPSA